MSVGVNSLIVTCYGPLTGTVVVYHDVWYNYDTKTENGDHGGWKRKGSNCDMEYWSR